MDIKKFISDDGILKDFEIVKEIIKNIRDVYQKYSINWKKDCNILSIGENNVVAKFAPIVSKLTNVSFRETDSSIAADIVFIIQNQKYSLSLGKNIAILELERMETELKYKMGFLESVKKKLSNEKFMSKAPASIIEAERKKMADAEFTILSLKESISQLKRTID